MAEINKINVGGTNYDVRDTSKLSKTTYEWNKEFAAGQNGAISLGRYNMYDTQLTFDITSTTTQSLSGKLVIATQNGNLCQAKVFGDASGTLVSKLIIYQSAISGSRSWIEVFCNFDGWSKNKVHIYAVALNSATVEKQMTSVTISNGVPAAANVTSGDTKWSGTIINDSHDISIAASSGTNELTLAHGTKYALTAGGQSFIFTTPSDNNTNTWRKVQLNGTDKLGTGTNTNPLNIKAGSNMTITESGGTFTFAATDTNTNTTYDLSAAKSKSNGSVTLDLTAGGSGSGTDSVTIKGTGATTVTTDANGVITINSTDNNTDTHYTKYLQIKGNGTEAVKFTQDADKSLNLKPGTNVSISAASGEITISATDTTYSSKAASSGGTAVSLVTTGEKYNWNAAKTHADSAHAPSDAEKNVQSDWNVTDTSSDAFIKNKPTTEIFVVTNGAATLSNNTAQTVGTVAGTALTCKLGTVITISGKMTASSFYANSDRRLKENIKEFIPQKSILDLPVVEFDFKDSKSHHIGCIAQDLQELFPELVETNENGYLSISENKLVYLCILELKKLKAELESLKVTKE